MALLLGLCAALSWGLSDFTVAIATRRADSLQVAFGFHVAAMVPLAVLLIATDGLDHITSGQVLGFVLIGAFGWLSYVVFYRALAIGPISLVSPIVSGYAAVTVVLDVVLGGVHLSAGEVVAVVLVFAGVTICSADVSQMVRERIDLRTAPGVLLGLVAMVLFGGFIYGVSKHRAGVGWVGPIFIGRGFAAVFLAAHTAQAGKLRIPRPALGLIALIGLLDTGGYLLFNVGSRHGDPAVVATASALYALVPVALGVQFLDERPNPAQWIGLAVVSAGLVLLGVAG